MLAAQERPVCSEVFPCSILAGFFWFCFLVILWSIYTNIKVLFIDLGHTAVLRGVGQPGDGRIPIDGCPFSPE